MAKWDLSKLPEGRKPLPDAWFKERAQMQERIKELEAQLAEYKYVASAIDTQWAESQDEIADLKAKLAKTVAPDTIWVDFNDEGAVVAGGAGPARYAGEHTYVKAQGGEDE